MDRRKRCIPGERCVVEIGPRDVEILDAVARCQFLDSTQIAREFFHSHDRALHRLRQLVDARLLNATLVSSRRPNLYSCTRSGLEALKDHGHAGEGFRLPPPIRASAVAHLALINDVRLYCGVLAQAGHGELLEWNSGRGQDARAAGLDQRGLVPDAIVALQLANRELTVFVEADCGHETADLEAKLQRYSLLLPGQATELWLACLGDRTRLLAVVRMCQRAGVDRSTRLFTRLDLVVRPAKPPVPMLAQLSDAFSGRHRAAGGGR